jgi:acyl carrier protein
MKDKILNVLKDVNEEIINYYGDSMIEDGLIDSFGIISIISGLEKNFDVEIDVAYMERLNFKNKDSIIRMMEKVLSSSGQEVKEN